MPRLLGPFPGGIVGGRFALRSPLAAKTVRANRARRKYEIGNPSVGDVEKYPGSFSATSKVDQAALVKLVELLQRRGPLDSDRAPVRRSDHAGGT